MSDWYWANYIHRNRTEGDCQLVAVVNAHYYLTGTLPSESKYQELIEMTGCRHGSVINLQPALDELELEEGTRFGCWPELLGGEYDLPLEASVWHKFFGFHSVLIVDVNRDMEALRVVNFRRVTSERGWIFWEDLQHYIVQNPDKEEPRWEFRSWKKKLERGR